MIKRSHDQDYSPHFRQPFSFKERILQQVDTIQWLIDTLQRLFTIADIFDKMFKNFNRDFLTQ